MLFFFFKQKTAYEWRISDWSSDVCSSDLARGGTGDIDRMPRGRCGCPHALGSDARHARRTRRCGGRRRDELRHLARLVAVGPVAVCGVRERGTWPDRKRVESGKRVSVRVDNGGRRFIKKTQLPTNK